jgi:hypothetical protein
MRYGSACSGIEAATVARFMEKVRVGSPDECWLWTAARHSGGYGKFGAGGRFGKTLLSHRASYTIHKGQIPAGLFVCHSCDNRLCVNPAHLWLGTAKDNAADMMRKGRFVAYDKSGAQNPAAKITRDQAMEIRRRAIADERQATIAADFGVSRNLVSEIKRGRIWI